MGAAVTTYTRTHVHTHREITHRLCPECGDVQYGVSEVCSHFIDFVPPLVPVDINSAGRERKREREAKETEREAKEEERGERKRDEGSERLEKKCR